MYLMHTYISTWLQFQDDYIIFAAQPPAPVGNTPYGPRECSETLQVIRSMRRQEQQSNFVPYPTARPKHTKPKPWTMKIVCLAETTQNQVPCTSTYKESLLHAGLGDKRATLPEISSSSDEFKNFIISEFPTTQSF